MSAVHVRANALPSAILQQLGYRGKSVRVVPCESVTISGAETMWDGGSRSTFYSCNLETCLVGAISVGQSFSGPLVEKEVELGTNLCIIKHSISCGKDVGLTFYIHPSNMPPKLDMPESTLTRDEEIVLVATRSLKSSYGGIKNYRLHEAHSYTGITGFEWERAKERLIEKGYLDKRGALTVEGRNVCPNKDLWTYREK